MLISQPVTHYSLLLAFPWKYEKKPWRLLLNGVIDPGFLKLILFIHFILKLLYLIALSGLVVGTSFVNISGKSSHY